MNKPMLLLLLLVGCAPAPAPSMTYWADVAPIINSKCVGCHQAGGIAPMSLDSFEAVKTNAALIAQATASKEMPPYLLTHDGTCGTWDSSATLTAEELDTLSRWAASPLAEGTPVTLQPTPRPSLEGATSFHTPTLVPVAEGSGLAEFDEYRCFEIDTALDADQFITGYEVIPGNAAIVHHALAFVVAPEHVTRSGKTNAQRMAELDASDPDRAGWPCFGLAGDGVEVESVPVSWAPGQGPVKFPAGFGAREKKSDKLIVQLHYNLADPAVRGQSDTTEVRVRYAPSVERRLVYTLYDPMLNTLGQPMPFTLAPGQASVTFDASVSLAQLGLGSLPYVDLVGVMPHMHNRGRKTKLELINSTEPATCLANVDRWDFHWQEFYFEAGTPTRLTAASTLKISCDYDTLTETAAVYPGWGTRNEMCLAVLMLALPQGL